MDTVEKIGNYLQYNSVVVLSYFFICLIVLGICKISNDEVAELFVCRRRSLLSPLFYLGLITHIIGHKDFEHLKCNFITILLIGPLLEEKYGSIVLLEMIVLCAVITGVINVIFSKKGLWGSSGVLYMLIVLSSFVNIENGKIPITLIFIFLFYVIDEVGGMVTRKKDGVSHMGHFIGALCGVVFGFMISLGKFPVLF